VRFAGRAAEREHSSVVVERNGPALQRRAADEDELAGRELVVRSVDREARAAPQDEVDLLVAEAAFGVLFDDRPAHVARGVGVDAESADPEASADRAPDKAVGQLDSVELVEVGNRHSASSTQRGSACRPAKSASPWAC
jgi:hypothetical protein